MKKQYFIPVTSTDVICSGLMMVNVISTGGEDKYPGYDPIDKGSGEAG